MYTVMFLRREVCFEKGDRLQFEEREDDEGSVKSAQRLTG